MESRMSIQFQITLSDVDLARLSDGVNAAGKTTKPLDADAIIASARKLLVDTDESTQPEFVRSRLDSLQTLIAMVEDAGFDLPEEERQRVLAALAYFADPEDAIPDDVPVLGLLDDAIMIELCARELTHEMEAYEAFRDWRDTEARRRGEDPAQVKLSRVDWAEAQRVAAIERMRQQREQSYTSGRWAPVLFKVH
jgi:uncharacterized membrane protein YkvA (DUF1232 family)